jgi:hypothetical protein
MPSTRWRAQLGGEVVLDDLGRRCTSREVAKRLFSQRADAEVRQREARERLDAQFIAQAAANRPWAGLLAGYIPDGVSPATAMLAAAKDAQPRRKSVLEHALSNEGEFEYIPIGPVPEQ